MTAPAVRARITRSPGNRPVFDVVIVEPRPVLDGRVAAQSIHLGQPCQPHRDPVPVGVAGDFLLELIDEEGPLGTEPTSDMSPRSTFQS